MSQDLLFAIWFFGFVAALSAGLYLNWRHFHMRGNPGSILICSCASWVAFVLFLLWDRALRRWEIEDRALQEDEPVANEP